MSDIKALIEAQAKKDEERNIRKENQWLIDEIKDLERELSFYRTAKELTITPITANPESEKREATALSLLSDIHYEERINSSSTNGLNEYTPEIANERIRRYFVNLLKLVENNRNDVIIDNLIIGVLGDNIHGFIHDEYVSTNWMTPIVASKSVLEQLVAGVQYLLDNGNFNHIKLVCKVGNHSRTTDKIYSMTELTNSYEYFIYEMMKMLFEKDERVEVIADESYFTFVPVYNKVIRFEHGHAFKYAGGIGGIYVPLMRHLLRGNKIKPFDLAVMGHWHSYESISTCLINGSVCGYNAYSIRKGFDFQPPMQQFQLIDSKRGFTVNTKIFLD